MHVASRHIRVKRGDMRYGLTRASVKREGSKWTGRWSTRRKASADGGLVTLVALVVAGCVAVVIVFDIPNIKPRPPAFGKREPTTAGEHQLALVFKDSINGTVLP